MPRYDDWSTLPDQLEGAIASGRMAGELSRLVPTTADLSSAAKRDAALAELLAAPLVGVSIRKFGPSGNGDQTQDTAAFQAAIASSDRVIILDVATYLLGVVGEVPFGMKFVGAGYGLTTLKKCTASSVFTVKTAGVEFWHCGFDADVATNTAYGTSGAMIDHPGGAFTSADGRIINCRSANLDTVIQFGPDGGARHQVIGGYWLPYTTTAGAEGKTYRTGVGGPDTGARFRAIVGLVTDGQIDETGSIDSEHAAVSCRRVITTATTELLGVQGGIWGSLGEAVTVYGVNTRIMGIRVSGNITLDATMTGSCCFIGNTQTAGTFIDSTPVGVCTVVHRPLNVDYFLFNKHKVYDGSTTGGVVETKRQVSPGDAAYTWEPVAGVSLVRYATALTADRTVTLSTTGVVNGHGGRVSRSAGDTGGPWTVSVGGLTTLATKEWADFQYTGSAYEITAKGSLP